MLNVNRGYAMEYKTGYYVWELDPEGIEWYVIYYEGDRITYYDCYHSRPSLKINWTRHMSGCRFKLINNDRLLKKYGVSIERIIEHRRKVGEL